MFRSILMRALCLYGTGVLIPIATVHAQEHRDIHFVFQDGKIVPNGVLHTANFPRSGISKQFTSNPGFASERDQGGGGIAGEQLVYNVLDRMLYWSEGQFREPNPGTYLRVQNNPPATVPDTIVSSSSAPSEGQWSPFRNRIGQAGAGGDIHSHVDFFLEPAEPEEPDQTPWTGAYGMKVSLETNRAGAKESDPMVLVFNYGLSAAVFDQAVQAFEARWLTAGVKGDFDGNSLLDVADIDLLSQVVRAGEFQAKYDLDENGLVNSDDRTQWVETLKKTFYGDANLDGEFNTTDFVLVFQQGEYEDSLTENSNWSDGDWNGDAEFNTADFILAFQGGGFEQGPRPAIASVPEPSAAWAASAAMMMLGSMRALRARRRRVSVMD